MPPAQAKPVMPKAPPTRGMKAKNTVPSQPKRAKPKIQNTAAAPPNPMMAPPGGAQQWNPA